MSLFSFDDLAHADFFYLTLYELESIDLMNICWSLYFEVDLGCFDSTF